MAVCPIAKLGYSRRPPGPAAGLYRLGGDGGRFPLSHEVLVGNQHDSTTVQTMVESLEKKYGTLNRVWVMDRGMVSEANLK